MRYVFLMILCALPFIVRAQEATSSGSKDSFLENTEVSEKEMKTVKKNLTNFEVKSSN